LTLDYVHCRLCPRSCGVDRTAGERGVCGQGDTLRLARAALHHWEEPPISGQAGSGTVFFSGCPLRCVYCQNREIALGQFGREVSVERLAQIFLEQQARGALNINLVTACHFMPQVIEAIDLARAGNVRARPGMLEKIEHPKPAERLEIPIVYNTSGYETPEAIEALDGYVDIYLTDFKYADSELAARYSHAPDYPEVASKALDAMFAHVGPVRMGKRADEPDEVMERGVIVRHLMLPGNLQDSERVMEVLAAKPYADDIIVSLMNQYTPLAGIEKQHPELATTVDADEYDELIDYALGLGLERSFMQEGGAVGESFIPAFDYEGI
jgi:putative pyruvate formate lyase activating enzyme